MALEVSSRWSCVSTRTGGLFIVAGMNFRSSEAVSYRSGCRPFLKAVSSSSCRLIFLDQRQEISPEYQTVLAGTIFTRWRLPGRHQSSKQPCGFVLI
jgi:hypothetical protein